MFWIIYAALFVIVVSLRRVFRLKSKLNVAQRDAEGLRCQRDDINSQLWSILSAFCRKDFLERRLLVSVERCDGVSGLGFKCKAAPYGVEGSFWKFSIERVIHGSGRTAVRVGVSADVDGRYVSFSQEFFQGSDDDRFQQGERFIKLAYRMDDRWRAYPHEQARVLVDTFFGPPGPTRATSCFDDEHIREAEVVPSTPSST